MGALHITAARAGEAPEFIAVERPGRSLFRVEGLTMQMGLDQ